MALQTIRHDACFIDARNRLIRLEMLACGHPGRRLQRLLPTRMRPLMYRAPMALLESADYRDWMYDWPESPTHAVIEQPSSRRPPARRRDCRCHVQPADAATPLVEEFYAALRVEDLVLHVRGDRCEPCGVI